MNSKKKLKGGFALLLFVDLLLGIAKPLALLPHLPAWRMAYRN